MAAPLVAAEALQQLVALGGGNWVTAPATSDAGLVQQWAAGGGGDGDGAGAARFGALAPGVAALCQSVRQLGAQWMLGQQRVLEWLQGVRHRGEEVGGCVGGCGRGMEKGVGRW